MLGLGMLGACNNNPDCLPNELPWMNRCVRRCRDIPGAICERDGAAIPDAFLDVPPTPPLDAAGDAASGLDAADATDRGDEVPTQGPDASDATDVPRDAPPADGGLVLGRGMFVGSVRGFTPQRDARAIYATSYTTGTAPPVPRVFVTIETQPVSTCQTTVSSQCEQFPGRTRITLSVPMSAGTYSLTPATYDPAKTADAIYERCGTNGTNEAVLFPEDGSVTVSMITASTVAVSFDATYYNGIGHVSGLVMEAPLCAEQR